MIVRHERPADHAAIRCVHVAAFARHPFSHQTEHLIVEALRDAHALDLSLVAEIDGTVVGHIAFSSARIGQMESGWSLLGPVGVPPEHQRRGIGRALVQEGVAALRERGARGCVLVGDPAYYHRFGFSASPGVTCASVPDAFVLCLPLAGEMPVGEIAPHPAFAVTAERPNVEDGGA